MTTFYDYRNNLPSTPYATSPRGLTWNRAFGDTEQSFVTRIAQGVQSTLPDYALVGSLPLIGADRRLVRGPLETDAQYIVRLKRAFDLWYFGGTATGIAQAFLDAGFGTVTNPPRIYTNGDWLTHVGTSTGKLSFKCSDPTITSLTFNITADGTAGISGTVDVIVNSDPPVTVTPIPRALTGDTGSGQIALFANGDFVSGDVYSTATPDGNLTLWSRWWISLLWPVTAGPPELWGASGLDWGDSGFVWGESGPLADSPTIYTLIGELASLWGPASGRFVGAWLSSPSAGTTAIDTIPPSPWTEESDVTIGGQMPVFFRFNSDAP